MNLNEDNSTILFLFSRTGNSLNVALRIQKNIEICEILSIPRVFEEKKFDYEAARIGFVFPVHFQDAPHIVREFLMNIKITGNWMGKIFLFRIYNDRKFKVNSERCVRCGTCVSVCPMNNIEIVDDKVTWNHNCECCLACIHWCPCNAIEHMKTHGIPRYHHPHIKVKHMRDFKSRS